jgi:hexosaminidase
VQNEKGLARSNEFIAFEGPDCEATIDLGKAITVNQVIAHSLDQRASWIWPPASINVFSSGDNKLYSPVSCINPQITSNKITCEFVQPIKARYVKLVVQNYGIIPDGNPGAGNRAWLFLDEIEIE